MYIHLILCCWVVLFWECLFERDFIFLFSIILINVINYIFKQFLVEVWTILNNQFLASHAQIPASDRYRPTTGYKLMPPKPSETRNALQQPSREYRILQFAKLFLFVCVWVCDWVGVWVCVNVCDREKWDITHMRYSQGRDSNIIWL